MSFPDAPRVIYDRNPLEWVLCQLRFPPILRIDTEIPATFQEKIRKLYPLYEAKPLAMPPGLPAELVNLFMGESSPLKGQVVHEFASSDRTWLFTLARDNVTLMCKDYESWQDFRGHLDSPLLALTEFYNPSIFSRVGLRYRDSIQPDKLGINKFTWADLLSPSMAGAYSDPRISEDIVGAAYQLVIRLSNNLGLVQVHHGPITDASIKDQIYVIDADFFSDQQVEIPHVLDQLDALNRQSGLFFRWCITDRLHQSLGPREVPRT